MPRYLVKIETPDGVWEDWGEWDYDVDEEGLWAMLSDSYKDEYGEYPSDAEITMIGDDDVV